MSTPRKKATSLYRPWPNLYYYAWGKIALDPAYPEVVRLLGDSSRPLLDLGCGMGLLTAYLRAHGHDASVRGVDLDGAKIQIAQQVLGNEQVEFFAGDALGFAEHAGDVVLLDALHYFSDEDQQALLEKIARSVAPGGMAVIRVTLNEPTWRFAATRFEEWFVSASKWIPSSGWNFPKREEVGRAFRDKGFSEQVQPMWGVTPFNSYLFTFRRAEN